MSNLQLVLICFYLGVAGTIRKSGLWYFEGLVAVRRVLESSESVVIQGRWPDSTRGSPDVDERKPRAL